jgi:CBS-domain-containing membrane protein
LTRLADLVAEPIACGLDDAVPSLGDEPICVVVDERRVVIGLVRATDVPSGRHPRTAEVMREGPSTYRPNVSAEELAPKLDDKHPPWVIVTTSSGVLVGVTTADAVRAAV